MKLRPSHTIVLTLALFALSVFAQTKLEGMVSDTNLTACGPVKGKPGKCEGTLVLDSKGKQTTVKITRDTMLKKGDQQLFLFQVKGAPVTITLGNDNVAQWVEVQN